ncbi:MAG: pantoate--beta-alanine ligase [Acidimicrobiaceae bacterium]|jgi:pantoate--beta-alanine ligase|nr:pantoate--beta-alanine ligase [Acidimicrobiaceae bacterium]
MSLTVLDRGDAFRKVLDAERASGRRIGLVPTMGSLHAGHISLMERAARECEVVVATLFVNPLQFGPAEDLETYPRDPEGDRAKAEAAGVAYLFAPSQAEMFPDAVVTVVSVTPLTDVLEGAIRPGHFQGVATIVTKLLSLAGPCRAYFGEKDFQQLAIVRRLTADLSLPAEIVGCPTVRALDGLALSSRNAYLTPEERAVAPTLYRALQAGATAAAHETEADAVRSVMSATVADQPALQLQYAEVVDPADLSPLTTLDRDARLLIAARLGRTRLIDNVAATH